MAKLVETYACIPSTERGRGILISGDPKTNAFLYCNGRSVIIRYIDKPLHVEVYAEHAYQTTVARFSPNGEWIASADVSGTVRIWGTHNGFVLKNEFRVLSGRIDDLQWSADGMRIVASGDGAKVERPMVKHKIGLWSPDKDKKLTYYVMNYGHSCWTSVPINAGLQRNGKSCRLRWINYLRPGLKRGAFSLQEEETILTLHGLLGNKWSQISQHLPGRTDNEIKNYLHSHLKKRLVKVDHHQDSASTEPSSSCLITSNFTNNSSADMDQLVPPVSRISSLPKLIFAVWPISLDEFQHDEFSKAGDQPFCD